MVTCAAQIDLLTILHEQAYFSRRLMDQGALAPKPPRQMRSQSEVLIPRVFWPEYRFGHPNKNFYVDYQNMHFLDQSIQRNVKLHFEKGCTTQAAC